MIYGLKLEKIVIFSKKSKMWFFKKKSIFLGFWVAQTTYTPIVLGGKHDADDILTIWKLFFGQNLKKSLFFQKNPKTDFLRKNRFF